MPLTVATLCQQRQLGLELLAGEGSAGNVIEAAHVCELRRPGPWLQGGELLMAIGILLPRTSTEIRGYVCHLVEARVSALALGLGQGLPYQDVPSELVAAARGEGLPLVTVPDAVPFIALTKVVFAARAAEARRELEQSMAAHRSLTAATASGRGLDGVLAAWRSATGVAAVVLDPVGRALAAVGADAPSGWEVSTVEQGCAPLLPRLAAQGMRGLVHARIGETDVELHPAGAERLRGALVLVGHVSSAARRVLPTLLSLLSIELERRHLSDEPQRRAGSQRMRRLLGDRVTDEHAVDVLASAGIVSPRVRGLAVAVNAGQATGVAGDLALALPGGLVAVRGEAVLAVAAEDVDLAAVAGRFATGLAAGIGPAVRPGAVARSVEQAIAALPTSVRLGRPAIAEEAGSMQLLLSLGDRDVVAAFAASVLAPVEAVDPEGQLARTLEAWLVANGSWEDAAAVLGVHRHTVRNRISRVEQVTGRDLSSASDRHEMWLAMRARDTVPAAVRPAGVQGMRFRPFS